MSRPPGIIKRTWFKWKSLKLPWRKQYLVGHDLAGNTFWEFKDALNANRFRRIVKYAGQVHYSDVKIPPQWHSWLRHTREVAPTIEEQQYEVSRQEMMKQLAAQADERWKSIPSFLDSPNRQQPQPAIKVQDPGGYVQQTEPEEKQGVRSAVHDQEKVQAMSEGQTQDEGRFKGKTKEKQLKEQAPWDKLRPQGAPSENWQPEQWTPGVAQRGQ